jgi:rare lipoprotein A
MNAGIRIVECGLMPEMPIHRGVKTLIALLLIAFATLPCAGQDLQGRASWYGGKFHGRLTSSGEVFDTNEMTAAHRTLPFGTVVKVTNQDNGKIAVVKINDRGPFVEGRIIDLSRAAATELGMVDQGVANVTLEIVDFASAKERYAIQVGAYALEQNAGKVSAALSAGGFVVTEEKTALGATRVSIRGIEAADLSGVRARLTELGFATYLVKKEKSQSPKITAP